MDPADCSVLIHPPVPAVISGGATHTLEFSKMEGIGNDFVLIHSLPSDWLRHAPRGFGAPDLQDPLEMGIDEAWIRQICDRHFGVGADQLLWLTSPSAAVCAQVRLHIYNADGGAVEMCGNGLRAVGQFLCRYWQQPSSDTTIVAHPVGVVPLHPRRHFHVALRDAVREVEVDPVTNWIRVQIASPQAARRRTLVAPFLPGGVLEYYEVNLGNPHAVIFLTPAQCRDPQYALERLGPWIEHHPQFPERTNVELVNDQPGRLEIRVWERGAGATLACGSGACASVVARAAHDPEGFSLAPQDVQLPGGTLRVSWAGPGEIISLEGPAREIYHGVLFLHGPLALSRLTDP